MPRKNVTKKCNNKKMISLLSRLRKDNRGNLILFATVFGIIAFSVVVAAVSGYAIGENRASVHKHNSEMAFQAAEAGLNYYRWHLAHDPTDYQDGTSTSGPYIHEYLDKDGRLLGYYSLNITPPSTGSTIVQVESTGWLIDQPQTKRILRIRLGFPSITDHALLSDADIWIGDTESTHGRLHSNHGIRFDGVCDAPVTSAVATYTCKYHQGCGTDQEKPGVWGQGGPQEFWSYPVAQTDFAGITINLAAIKANAENNGLYFTSSGAYGWRLLFKSNGTIEANKVTSLSCYKGRDVFDVKQQNFCVDIKTLDSNTSTYSIPTSSFVFVEDNIWVQGVVKGRATVGTSLGKSIMIPDSITYYAKDGNHVLGLIAEQNIIVPHNTPDDMEINAAVVAQNGGAKRYDYPGDIKDELIIYGSVISKGIWTWSWTSGGGPVTSGYRDTRMLYDEHLTFGPPAGFPVGSEYQILSWEIIQ